MARRKPNQDEVIGQDSFLDVVANLVGILIILVMVVGARAKDAIVQARVAAAETSADISEAEVSAAKSAADQLEADFRRIEGQIRQQDQEISFRNQERDRVQMLVTVGEQALNDERQKLDAAHQQMFDQRKDLIAAEAELESLRRNIGFLEDREPETQIIEHLPTPMAKTVFGRELHLRMQAGRVMVVPWEEFLTRLKLEIPRRVERLRDQDSFTDTIGPVGGFWMRYTLRRASAVTPSKVGITVQQTVELDKFVLLPESDGMGEPVDEALRDGSQLRNILANHRPNATTITVWTYPDSFNEFRRLKRDLFERGFVTAARPLPDGHPIGGSPDGTRSAAQ